MIFNKDINGFDNEKEFVRYFNNKSIVDFDPMTVEFLEVLFDKIPYACN